MKKMMMFSAFLMLAATGCITVNKNNGGESNMKMPISQDIIHEKLSVSQEQVSGKDTVKCLFGFITWGSTAPNICDVTDYRITIGGAHKAMNGAYANACAAAPDCDRLVATRYTITTESYFIYKTVTAEVKGYPAKITGVEVIEPKQVRPIAPDIR